MDDKFIFDRRTQLERLRSCEDFFKTLSQQYRIKFDEEANFVKSAKTLREFLDTKFPEKLRNSDRRRISMILYGMEPKPIAISDVDEIIKLLSIVVEYLDEIDRGLSHLKKHYDGLGGNLEDAVWLCDWLSLKKEGPETCEVISKEIQQFNTTVHDLMTTSATTTPRIIVTIQTYMAVYLLKHCDERLKSLHVYGEYKANIVEYREYKGFVKKFYAHFDNEDPNKYLSSSATISDVKERIIDTLKRLKDTIERFERHIRSEDSRRLLRMYKWEDAIAKHSFLADMDEEIKACIKRVREDALKLLPLIPQKQAIN
ncbi:hypothetical protein TCE0_033r09289 [Talaromyces pinophilus]|jgi:hypothetical protein|uniref:Uncharacterized protein n=1 Tax=Talaromyces pinophilus TaxID=128442 RepID=A0A6V8HAR4_TALPI|nr:hypothetical protein TCE0_033r09289 [Talaromyces pinophilus]